MVNSKTTATLEPAHSHSHLLCWRSTVAGLLISIMSYMLLSALGVAIIGLASQSAIENETGASALATGAGLWMGISAVVSLFVGSYFAVRISKNITNKVGTAQGLVVASTFFIILSVLASSAIGSLSMGLGHLISGMSRAATSVGTNPRVQDTINETIGTSTFKSDLKTVSEGITVRLVQGDVESAKSYYAYQTGQSRAQVSAKIDQLKADFDRTAKDVGEKASGALAATGISLFVTFLVGLIAAGIGGRVGAHSNAEKPLTMEDTYTAPMTTTINRSSMLANQQGSAMPYIFGWLLGIPVSILFLIFALRTIF